MNDMVERAHAKLSASGSKKWLTCTPSAHIEDQYPDEQTTFSAEGTFAHEVFELVMHARLGTIAKGTFFAKLEKLHEDKHWSEELHDHVLAAVEVAMERVEAARARCADPVILVEQRLDFSYWVPEGFGTGDLVIITDGLVEVLDLKYGKGVYVEAADNSQMRLYGLGAYHALHFLYDIMRVRMTILQPRLNNYGTEELAIEDLLIWARHDVKPRALLAWEGKGDFVAGDHCSSGFCRARFTCAARAEQALQLARSHFALVPAEQLTVEQVAEVLTKGDSVAKWIGDVQEYALKAAKQGQVVPGFKLVEGRSNRKYVDQDLVAQKLTGEGIEEAVIYERSLLGITAMEKAIGKKKFEQLLGDLVEKPPGKPVLVAESDKRTALESNHGFTAIADNRS